MHLWAYPLRHLLKLEGKASNVARTSAMVRGRLIHGLSSTDNMRKTVLTTVFSVYYLVSFWTFKTTTWVLYSSPAPGITIIFST
jgi:hypothetical protein